MELRLFVVTFGAEDLHQLSHTNSLLEDLKQGRNTSSHLVDCSDGLRRLYGLVWDEQLTDSWWSRAVKSDFELNVVNLTGSQCSEDSGEVI